MSALAIDTRLLSRLKTRQLILLVHLDHKRSILRAAEAANMTQPAASKLLAELEDSLGVALFVRHARGVEPTSYGEVLLRHARNALSELHEAQEEIANLKSGSTGHASIGTVVTSATSLVPMAVAELKAMADFFRARLGEIVSTRMREDEKIKKLNERLVKLQRQIGAQNDLFSRTLDFKTSKT